MPSFAFERLDTPTGPMLLATDEEERLRVADWEDHAPRVERLLRLHYRTDRAILRETTSRSAAARTLLAYFDGDLAALDRVATQTGGTDFQRAVWAELRTIPAGATTTYGSLAVRLGCPRAVRAVGLANGANPIAVVVPCHRVVGADASLTGYGGGLARKQWLLEHEGIVRQGSIRFAEGQALNPAS